jgi:hypothetical protein
MREKKEWRGRALFQSYQTLKGHPTVLLDKTMANPPNPPESLPQYITDGVPKQDTKTLRDLQQWIDDILEYRSNISPDDIEADANESIEAVEESSGGTVVIKKVSCGKDNCKCQSGERHGPYKYIVSRQGGNLKWEYEGPVSE